MSDVGLAGGAVRIIGYPGFIIRKDGGYAIWVKRCVRYEKLESLNTCGWTGNKRYCKNVIVIWTTSGDSLDEAGSRLDKAVSAAVSGS